MLRAAVWITTLNALCLGVVAWLIQSGSPVGYWLVVPYLPIAIGSVVWLMVAPFHLLEEFHSWRLRARTEPEFSQSLPCPVTGEKTTDLKQFHIPTKIRFWGIAASVRSEEVVACPNAMRKALLKTIAFNLLLGNLLTLFYLPSLIALYCRTFVPGHSARLFHAKHGLIPQANAGAVDECIEPVPVVLARGRKRSNRHSHRHHGVRVHA